MKLTEYYLENFWKRILPIWAHIVSLLSITMCSDRQAALYIKMSYQAQTSIKSCSHIVGTDLSLLLGGESHPGFIFLDGHELLPPNPDDEDAWCPKAAARNVLQVNS